MAFSGKWNLLAVLIFFVISCGPSQRGLFGDRVHRTDTVARLLEQPSPFAAAKLLLAGNTGINIIGSYNNYYLAEYNSFRGWLEKSSF